MASTFLWVLLGLQAKDCLEHSAQVGVEFGKAKVPTYHHDLQQLSRLTNRLLMRALIIQSPETCSDVSVVKQNG